MSLMVSLFHGWFPRGYSGRSRDHESGKKCEKRQRNTITVPAAFRGQNKKRLSRQLRALARAELLAMNCSRHAATVWIQTAEASRLKIRVRDGSAKAGEGTFTLDFTCWKAMPLDVVATLARYFFSHAASAVHKDPLLEVHKGRSHVQVTLRADRLHPEPGMADNGQA